MIDPAKVRRVAEWVGWDLIVCPIEPDGDGVVFFAARVLDNLANYELAYRHKLHSMTIWSEDGKPYRFTCQDRTTAIIEATYAALEAGALEAADER